MQPRCMRSVAALFLAALAPAGAQSISQTTTYNFCGGFNGGTVTVESTAPTVFYNLTTNTAPLYPNSVTCNLTLRPGAGLGMSFRFDSFATEATYDFFKAAAASGAPLVPSSSGFTAPQLGLALYSPADQSVTLTFSSDSSFNFGGVAVRVGSTFNAIGGAPRACNDGATAQSCRDLRTEGCNWCQDGAGRCDFTGRPQFASSLTEPLGFPRGNFCILPTTSTSTPTPTQSATLSQGASPSRTPSGTPSGSGSRSRSPTPTPTPTPTLQPAAATNDDDNSFAPLCFDFTCRCLSRSFLANSCTEAPYDASAVQASSAAGIAVGVVVAVGAGAGAWLVLFKRVGGAALPPQGLGELPGLRLALALLAAAIGCCAGATALAIAAPSMAWVLVSLTSGGSSFYYALSPLGGLRLAECRGSACLNYQLSYVAGVDALIARGIGASFVVFSLGFLLPATLLLAPAAVALKRYLLLTLSAGGAAKAEEVLAPHCCLNLQAAYALAWTGFSALLCAYSVMSVQFVPAFDTLFKSEVEYDYSTPGATAADLGLTLAFFGALFGTMAACRLGALGALRPGPCGRCCCCGRCAPQAQLVSQALQVQRMQQAQLELPQQLQPAVVVINHNPLGAAGAVGVRQGVVPL